jgi:hypothetical protein
MKVELEIKQLPVNGQWAFFYTFDQRAHLVLAQWSKECPDFTYKIEKLQKVIVRGELTAFPCKIWSLVGLPTSGYISGNQLFFLNRYVIGVFVSALHCLPSSKKSNLFRQAREVKILIGSQIVTLKHLMDLFKKDEDKHRLVAFIRNCLYRERI